MYKAVLTSLAIVIGLANVAVASKPTEDPPEKRLNASAPTPPARVSSLNAIPKENGEPAQLVAAQPISTDIAELPPEVRRQITFRFPSYHPSTILNFMLVSKAWHEMAPQTFKLLMMPVRIIREQCLNKVAQFKNLELGGLDLSHDKQRALLGQLCQLSQLKELSISDRSDDADSHMESIRGLTGLDELSVSCGSTLSAQGLNEITYLRNLDNLCFSGLRQDHAAGFTGFTVLTKLNTLKLTPEGNIGDLSSLGGLTNLKTLRLTSQHNMGNLGSLKSFTALNWFDFKCSKTCAFTFEPLQNLSKLKYLTVNLGKGVEGNLGGTFLTTLTSLQFLNVHCGPVNHRDQTKHEIYFPRSLTTLFLSGNSIVANKEGVRQIASLTNLRRLILGGYGVEKAWFSGIYQMPSLTSLDLKGTNLVFDSYDRKNLSQKYTHLTILANEPASDASSQNYNSFARWN